MKIGVISLFPDIIESLRDRKRFGLIAKAFSDKKLELFVEDLRDHGLGKHKDVDDTPYGGGDGMVLRPEPLESALESILNKMEISRKQAKTLYTCPSGELWTQKKATDWIKKSEKNLVIFCGRYAGIDQRAVEELIDEKISMGPYVLNGGELPALCIIETLARIVPGVLGNPVSASIDSFSDGLTGLEAEAYTKPQTWKRLDVPEVLLSGDHSKIEAYRKERSIVRTEKWLEKALSALKSSIGG